MLMYNPKLTKCKINDNHIKQKAPNLNWSGAFCLSIQEVKNEQSNIHDNK